MSLDGTLSCYRNPLAFDPDSGEKIRNDWYDTTCCPPNLERTFASLPGYFYSTGSDGLYVHLFHNSELNWRLENGAPITIKQKTDYPWQGSVDIEVSPASRTEFTLYLRIPRWSSVSSLSLNEKPTVVRGPGRYLPLRRRWSKGDTLRLEFDMSAQILEANARVVENHGRVAIQRGPLVYCLEQLDQPKDVSLSDVALVPGNSKHDSGFSESFDKNLLGGIVALHHEGVAVQTPGARRSLYFPASAAAGKSTKIPLTFIPYYTWANRAPTPMQVWTSLLRT
jgi:hypothetical protein